MNPNQRHHEPLKQFCTVFEKAADTAGVLLSRKADPYLNAGIATGFSNHDLGPAPEPTLEIGFTVNWVQSPVHQPATQALLLALFAGSPNSRLTVAAFSNSGAPAFSTYLTASVTFPTLFALMVLPFVTEVQLCANLRVRRPLPRWAKGPNIASGLSKPPISGEKRLIAILDHGCPFAHADLQNAGVPRVLALWDQDLYPDFPLQSGSTPCGFGYGRQVLRNELNGFIQSATDAKTNLVDEKACYEQAKYAPMRHRFTHGSLALGLLAGNQLSPSLSASGKSEDNSSDLCNADLVFVQLPRSVASAPDRGSIERCIVDAATYVLACAGPKTVHIALMLDYGTELGPHNGESWFERALESVVVCAKSRAITMDVVFAAGNGHEVKRHAQVFPSPPTKLNTAQLGWWLPRANDAPCMLEIWTEKGNKQFSIEIISPEASSNNSITVTSAPRVQVWPTAGGTHPSLVIATQVMGNDLQILVQISPTAATHSTEPIAPPGLWTLKFNSKNVETKPLYVYAAWGGRNIGFPMRLGRSFLIARENAVVTGNGSILGSALGDSSWTVGGREKWGDMDRVPYSSAGAGRGVKLAAGNASARAVSAVVDQSPSLPGLLCMGVRTGVWVRAGGTSFAAPQVARELSRRGDGTIVIYPIFVAQPLKRLPVGRIKNRSEYSEYRLNRP